ncbi:MAG: hypothetical protein C0478_06610 [Planctomyces sp.]|nr:hypothetical protein [Planctomyces sp.]
MLGFTILLVSTLFLASYLNLEAAELRDEIACKEAIRRAIEAIREGNSRRFVEAIENHEGEVTEELNLRFEALSQKITQERIKFAARYGEPLGTTELVKTEKISDRFLRFTVLDYHERSAAVYRISYYRPRETWTFHFLNWSDDITTLYEKTP